MNTKLILIFCLNSSLLTFASLADDIINLCGLGPYEDERKLLTPECENEGEFWIQTEPQRQVIIAWIESCILKQFQDSLTLEQAIEELKKMVDQEKAIRERTEKPKQKKKYDLFY